MLKRTLEVAFKLLPRILMLRHYRDLYLKGKEIDEKEVEEEAEKMLNALISLGPTFIKIGQMLSVHSDVLPEGYLKVLSRLQDQVPPSPWESVKQIIDEDLGERAKELEINPVPLSSASIGQVYLAKYKGKDVVVKVNRPRIRETVEEDIQVIKRLMPFLRFLFDESFYESFKVIVNDFSSRIFEEMDFTKEEFYMRKIAEELSAFPDVIVPKPYFSTKRVLVMEYVKGYKVTSEEAKKIVEPSYLAYKVFKVFMVMLLEKDYFHADPHPGNIAVDEKGNLIIYDFGMVGRMDKDTRNKLIRAYASLVRLDGIGLVKVLDELGAVQPEADRELLAKGIEIFLSAFRDVTPETLEVEQFLNAANEVFYRFPLRLPQKLVLYIRMTSTLGGTCLQIDPEFKFFEKLVELIEEEGLELSAMVDEIKDTFSSALRKFRLSLLEKPIVTKKEKVDKIPIVFVIIALIIYLVLKQPVPSILVAILGLALKR
ncbi:MAG: AarF/UbiB family protein [Candidatus Aramenus sulfurataquae]|jgi:predicted unusual protein kinase regulating ubiquinone biosynthesis (AarF/ABC1/UbiB family)|uniref:AarF/UbiB family protein n=4 Tax=Candidatus Aramenus sulfurataquae TaxID=1326980 RepID=A0AAE3FJ86_9CREN|nr:AarF/UbiB family protein [Candidatus Aramenus sulfurataquae]